MQDRPLTILQLTHEGHGAGSTMMIASLSRQLAGRGHRVLMGCRAESVLARMVRDAGLPQVPLDFGRLAPLARELDALMTRERVDVVNSHGTGDRRALTWLRWRGRLGRPFVVTRHTMPLTSPAELLAVGLSADRTIAVSHAVARALRRRLYPTGRLRVVTNGIELARVEATPSEEDMAAARAALGDLAGRPVVLVLARRNDQHVLLRGLASSCGGSSRASAPPSEPKRSTGKHSSGAARSTAIARTRVEHDASPGPQFPAVRWRHRPHDGRGRAALPSPRPDDFDRNVAGLGSERSALPPDHRPRGDRRQASAHSERAGRLDLACRVSRPADATRIRLVRRGQAPPLPGRS